MEEEQGHPIFSNVLILTKIFKFLTIPELKSVRLVSNLWETISIPIFQGGAAVTFFERPDKPQNEEVMLKRFLEAITPSRLNLGDYKFCFFNFDLVSEPVMAAFWERCGPFIEYLELTSVRLVGVGMVRDILFNLCPNLRRIELHCGRIYDTFDNQRVTLHEKKYPLDETGKGTVREELAPLDENVRVNKNLISLQFAQRSFPYNCRLPISWEEVFLAYPNLRDLYLYDLNVEETEAILEIVTRMKTRNPNFFGLKALHIFNNERNRNPVHEIRPETMDRLLDLQLCLKELSMDLGIVVNHKKVAQLLQQQSELETMILFRGPEAEPMREFPFRVQFNKLVFLEMTSTVSHNMTFLQFMPNLKELKLCVPPETGLPRPATDIISNTDLNFAERPLLPKLTRLKIHYPISAEDVKKLISWFQDLKDTKLHLDNEGFRSVCGEWRNLEYLEVYGDKLTAEGITGISKLNVKDFQHGNEFNPINITCLTQLKGFTMVNKGDPTGIDDVCVDEGFMKLPCLNYLKICSKDISRDGWTKLFNWDQLVTLKPWSISNATEETNWWTTFHKPGQP